MTCKIERLASAESTVVLRLCGRIQLEHVSTIKESVGQEGGGVVLDLKEVTLVDRDAVNFLAICELKGMELRNCPAFLRQWVAKEQSRLAAETPNIAAGAINDVDTS
jgi:anti-anti-sigma regulatory factor